MPTTLTGLALFLVLLLPGLVYVMIRERFTPRRDLSIFRETVQVVAVSVVALLAVAVLAAVLRALMPSHTPDVDELVREGRDYATEHYASLAVWSVGLLSVATAGAGIAALVVRKRPPPEAYISSWWELFRRRHSEKDHIHVACVLDDGTYVSGYLCSFTLTEQETPDRDLILKKPIQYRPPRREPAPGRRWLGPRRPTPDPAAVTDMSADEVCISAAKVKVMFVSGPPEAAEAVGAAEE